MTIDAQILRALRAAHPAAVSGADLSQRLGISRAAIWARIEALRELSYEIEASPHLGYRLLSAPDLLHADDIMARLEGTSCLGREVRVFQETASTNDLIEQMASHGVAQGMVVVAESQTRGRGRLGRTWSSLPGKGLWFSVLLRPQIRPQAAPQLTVAAALSLWRAVYQLTGLSSEIKWPNDLLIQGKKISGILTEMSAEMDHVKHLVIGAGLNVNHQPRDFPAELRSQASSLALASGQLWNRSDLLVAILREMDSAYRKISSGGFSALAEEWRQRCTTLGRQVTIRQGNRLIHGLAETIDEEGALLVRTQHGRLERVTGGDVTVMK